MKRKQEEQLIVQALEVACQAEQRPYEQGEAPPLSPGFKERIMAQYQTYTEATMQQNARKRRGTLQRWVCAAAALMIVCLIGLSLPYIQDRTQRWIRIHADRPGVSYTISRMPAECTQVCQERSFYMIYTQWETEQNDRIVLLQEEASPEALLEEGKYRKKKIYTETITGTLYIGNGHTVLIWKNDRYYFLMMMDGALTDENLVIQTAESLIATV